MFLVNSASKHPDPEYQHLYLGVGRAPSMLGCSLVRINFGSTRLARYSNLDARCSLDTRRVFFGPQIGRFWANFWLNLGKIMGLFWYQKFFIHFWLEISTKSADFGPISIQICDLVESWKFFGRFFGVFIMAVMLDTRSVFEPWCSSSLDTRTFQKRGARARSVLGLFDARPSLAHNWQFCGNYFFPIFKIS